MCFNRFITRSVIDINVHKSHKVGGPVNYLAGPFVLHHGDLKSCSNLVQKLY